MYDIKCNIMTCCKYFDNILDRATLYLENLSKYLGAFKLCKIISKYEMYKYSISLRSVDALDSSLCCLVYRGYCI